MTKAYKELQSQAITLAFLVLEKPHTEAEGCAAARLCLETLISGVNNEGGVLVCSHCGKSEVMAPNGTEVKHLATCNLHKAKFVLDKFNGAYDMVRAIRDLPENLQAKLRKF